MYREHACLSSFRRYCFKVFENVIAVSPSMGL